MIAGNHEFYSGSNEFYDAPIEIREVGLVCSGQSSDTYAPALAFHWGGRVATRILLAADGQLKIEANPIIHSGNIGSYAAGNVTTPSGTYKHLGAWGVGRTNPGVILVNTAYRADIATTAQNIAGGIPGGMVPVYSARQSYGKDVTHTAPKNRYVMLSFGYGTFQIAGVTLINSTYVDFCSKHTQDVAGNFSAVLLYVVKQHLHPYTPYSFIRSLRRSCHE